MLGVLVYTVVGCTSEAEKAGERALLSCELARRGVEGIEDGDEAIRRLRAAEERCTEALRGGGKPEAKARALLPELVQERKRLEREEQEAARARTRGGT